MKVSIDADKLSEAFEANSIELTYYLNLRTGSFKVVLDKDVFGIDQDEDDEDDDDEDVITPEDPEFGYELWQQVPFEESWEGYNRMVSFTESVRNLKLKNSLINALNGRKPFRHFKDVLLYYPDDREKWFAFEQREREEKASDWLAELEEKFGITFEVK